MKTITRKLLAVLMTAVWLCLLIPVGAVAAADTNLLANGNFETGDLSGWTNLWNGCTVEMVAGRNGGSALHFQSGQWHMVRQQVAVEANTDYVLTAWAKDAANVTFLVKDGNDSVNIVQAATSGGSAWREYKATFNSGANTSIFVSIMGNNPGADAIVDDLKLVKVGGGDTPDTPDIPDEPYVPVEGNFIANGSFEVGDATGWRLYQSSRVVADAAKTGHYGLYLQGSGGWGGLGNQTIEGLEIGKTYRISLYYKALSGGVNIKLCSGASDTGPTYAYIYGTKTEWTQFAVEFEATDTTAFFTFIGSGTGTAEKMYVDDITLTEVKLGGNDDDPNLKMIDTLMDNIKTQGRTALVGGTLMLDFSISGIEFTFYGSGDVYATFNARKLSNVAADGGVYFTIVVDGVAQPRDYCRIASVGETKVLLAEGLSAGKHTFAIYRQSEHSSGEVGICALSYDGTIWKGSKGHNYIEFIGDSISCGFGNLGTNAQGDGAALWSDGTQAYPFLTAQAVCADWSNVSWSGLGCKYGYSSTTMQDVYPAQRYNYDQSTPYDFSKREPDVIVLALGTNDNSCQSNATLKRAGLVEMLTLVREKNPGVPIVWIYNMMTNGVNAMVEDIVAQFGGAEAGYYACKLTMNTAGGGYHPNLAGQQKFADELSAFLLEKDLVEIPEDPVPPSPTDDILLSGGETARMEMTEDLLGLAFRFQLADVQGITMDKDNVIDLTNATVSLDHGSYKLLAVGAIVTNDVEVGLRPANMTRENLSGYTKDVPAVYANDLTEDGLKYAVRVTNIPWACSDSIVYARGYYVYERDGEEVVVYGEVYAANYDNSINTNDGIFEW